MSISSDSLLGLEFSSDLLDAPLLLDFAATGEASSIILLAGWWYCDWDSMGSPYYSHYDVPVTSESGSWKIGRNFLYFASDATSQASLDANRDKADFERPAYLAALLQLRDEFPDIRFDDWIAAIQTRPLRDPVQEYRKNASISRQMAKVYMLGEGGGTVDVLVIDDRGQAAQGGDDPYLGKIADEFRNKDSVPSLADYVNWVATQTPYGGRALSGPSVFQSGGMIDDVASTLLASRTSSLT